MQGTVARLTRDNFQVPANGWSDPFILYDIWSIYLNVVGGDILIRFAPYPTSGNGPNFSDQPDGELIRAGTSSFDHLDNTHAAFSFRLADPAAPATIDFKAQRKAAGD